MMFIFVGEETSLFIIDTFNQYCLLNSNTMPNDVFRKTNRKKGSNYFHGLRFLEVNQGNLGNNVCSLNS